MRLARHFAFCAAVALATAPVEGTLRHAVSPADACRPVLRDGDIVFRRGVGAEAAAVMLAQGGGEFSHAGLAVVRGERVWVVHAAPAEAPEDRDAVKVDTLEVFLGPSRASAGAVFRLDERTGSTTAAQAAVQALDMAARSLPFDKAFDLSTPDAVYCTELVWRAYRAAGLDLAVRPSLRNRLAPGAPGVLLPVDLAQSPFLHRVL